MTVHTNAAGTKTVDPRFKSRLREGIQKVLKPEAEHWMNGWIESNDVVQGHIGWNVMASCNGDVIVEDGGGQSSYGEDFTGDTIINLSTIARYYFRYALMKLVEDGDIASYSTTVESILSTGGTQMGGLTIDHLLSGTAGWSPFDASLWDLGDSWFNTQYTKQDRIDLFKDLAPLSTHGDIAYYADGNRVNDWVIAHVIEAVTGQDWQDAIQDVVLTPLGLTDTYPTYAHARQAGRAVHQLGQGELTGGAGDPRVPLGYVEGITRGTYSLDVDYGIRGMYGSIRDLHKLFRAGVVLNATKWGTDFRGEGNYTNTAGCGLFYLGNLQGVSPAVPNQTTYINDGNLGGRLIYCPTQDVFVTLLEAGFTETADLNEETIQRVVGQAITGEQFTEASYMTDGVYTG